MRLLALRVRVLELARFLSVGGVAFVVDLGLFNLLRFGPGELLVEKPITARVLSIAAATVVSWLGNRHWTFAEHRTARRGREFTAYALVNAAGVVLGVGTLALSHYVLGFTTPLADNVANVIGIGLGTVVRYIGYKTLVFTSASGDVVPTVAPPVVLEDVTATDEPLLAATPGPDGTFPDEAASDATVHGQPALDEPAVPSLDRA
ncbi:hypothetical protein Q760_05130 [Cellulomonas cellasea DSM 20118]|uniref:GtrA/DPMS transmembrane domain-containing protein n=2 Tax=Cellulomonas cellasea TaxID=43670 RepID=A0A0A0B6N4_9CELL|nr:hypothetical protein Q760_05130 [Cellulomonas cellasea DSM 20118]GEA89944.1 hypothetical protein CCE01nite_38930 [Cellulomonas cellasea]